jgi:hypothetical protein
MIEVEVPRAFGWMVGGQELGAAVDVMGDSSICPRVTRKMENLLGCLLYDFMGKAP